MREPYLMYAVYSHDTGHPVALAGVRAEAHLGGKASFQTVDLVFVQNCSSVHQVRLDGVLRAPVAATFGIKEEEDYLSALMNFTRNKLKGNYVADTLLPEVTDWVPLQSPAQAKAAYSLIQEIRDHHPGTLSATDRHVAQLTGGEQTRLTEQFVGIMGHSATTMPHIARSTV